MTNHPRSTGPLVATVLFPLGTTPVAVESRLTPGPRPIEVLCVPYAEDAALRVARAEGADEATLAAMAPPIAPETLAALARTEALLALDPPNGLVELAPRLRWVQTVGAGIGQWNLTMLRESGIRVSTAAGVGAPSIAEFVLYRLLEVVRHGRQLESLQSERRWQMVSTGTLAGRTIGIVGLGAIGTEVGRLARAFGMRVLGLRARPERGNDVVDEVMGPDELPRLLEASDVVVLAAPSTPRTRGLIGPAELSMMRPGAILCNVARGSLVDEEALRAGLVAGHLGAAILDVTAREPLPADDPLWETPNVYLSSHTSVSLEVYDGRLLDLFAANLGRYGRGEPLVNEIDASYGR